MIDQERTTPYNIIISRRQVMQLKKKINLGINYKWLIQYQILQTKLTSWEFLLTNNIIIISRRQAMRIKKNINKGINY